MIFEVKIFEDLRIQLWKHNTELPCIEDSALESIIFVEKV